MRACVAEFSITFSEIRCQLSKVLILKVDLCAISFCPIRTKRIKTIYHYLTNLLSLRWVCSGIIYMNISGLQTSQSPIYSRNVSNTQFYLRTGSYCFEECALSSLLVSFYDSFYKLATHFGSSPRHSNICRKSFMNSSWDAIITTSQR